MVIHAQIGELTQAPEVSSLVDFKALRGLGGDSS